MFIALADSILYPQAYSVPGLLASRMRCKPLARLENVACHFRMDALKPLATFPYLLYSLN